MVCFQPILPESPAPLLRACRTGKGQTLSVNKGFPLSKSILDKVISLQ
jgi:hypothetical protein